jgi:hypothetical protein
MTGGTLLDAMQYTAKEAKKKDKLKKKARIPTLQMQQRQHLLNPSLESAILEKADK